MRVLSVTVSQLLDTGNTEKVTFFFICYVFVSKQKKEYILDKDGNKIYDPKKRQYKCKSIPATDWNEQTKAEEWRAAWAGLCNQALEQNGHAERIDHRSYERQGIDQIPTVHLGVAASAMEKRGIRTGRGDLNREIEVTNQKLRQLKARISKILFCRLYRQCPA